MRNSIVENTSGMYQKPSAEIVQFAPKENILAPSGGSGPGKNTTPVLPLL